MLGFLYRIFLQNVWLGSRCLLSRLINLSFLFAMFYITVSFHVSLIKFSHLLFSSSDLYYRSTFTLLAVCHSQWFSGWGLVGGGKGGRKNTPCRISWRWAGAVTVCGTETEWRVLGRKFDLPALLHICRAHVEHDLVWKTRARISHST